MACWVAAVPALPGLCSSPRNACCCCCCCCCHDLQMNRTIQNYQKAYRKKVEGLKQELTSTRSDNQHLRSQVRRLRKRRLLHAPSLLVGAAAGVALAPALGRLLQRWLKQHSAGAPEQVEVTEAS